MQIMGITGGIATGKSAVLRMFGDLGAPMISADSLARDLLAPGTLPTRAVLAAFPECADGHNEAIDRRALSQRIFHDADARARLEALTHPAIIAALNQQFALWRLLPNPRAGAAEIPLLFEAKLEQSVDTIIVVTCVETTQITRLCQRLNLSDADARQMLAAQWPLAEKVARADFVITTDNGFDDTRRQVDALWAVLHK